MSITFTKGLYHQKRLKKALLKEGEVPEYEYVDYVPSVKKIPIWFNRESTYYRLQIRNFVVFFSFPKVSIEICGSEIMIRITK